MPLDTIKREITAPVLIPEMVDYHGHIYSEEEVYKACRNYQETCEKANIQHLMDVSKSAYFTEHYISPVDMLFGDKDDPNATIVPKGSWMATMKIANDALWEDVQKGKFTGFSIRAKGMAHKLKQDLQKAKVAGSAAGEEGIVATKRFTDFDFSSEDSHVALVDEAANATEVLVMKSKQEQQDNGEDMDKSTKEAVKKELETEKEMEDLKKAKEAQEAEMEELKKAKEAQDAEMEELKKFKAEQEAKIEELEKARKEKEFSELVQKSKELKADDADKLATILQKCKYSLEDGEYETLVKQLEKLKNIDENSEFLQPAGEANPESIEKSKDDLWAEKRQEYIEKGLNKAEASKKARLEIYKK